MIIKRPVFIVNEDNKIPQEKSVEFDFCSGYSFIDKQASVKNLHEAFKKENPERKIIEISSKSTDSYGIKASAFNLKFNTGLNSYFVENVFQASKVFGEKGPFTDLLHKNPVDSKRDVRLRESGVLTCFRFNNEEYPLIPKTFFYDWIYIQAISQ